MRLAAAASKRSRGGETGGLVGADRPGSGRRLPNEWNREQELVRNASTEPVSQDACLTLSWTKRHSIASSGDRSPRTEVDQRRAKVWLASRIMVTAEPDTVAGQSNMSTTAQAPDLVMPTPSEFQASTENPGDCPPPANSRMSLPRIAVRLAVPRRRCPRGAPMY